MLSQCETGSSENLRMVQLSPRPPVTSQPRSARSSQAVVDVFTPRNETKTLWQAARGNRKWTSGMLDLADEDCFSSNSVWEKCFFFCSLEALHFKSKQNV